MARTVLTKIIVNMIFVSINPFALRRFFFFFFAVVGLSCVSFFGQCILLGVTTTPYDGQMAAYGGC